MARGWISFGRNHRQRGGLHWLLSGWLALFLVVGPGPSALAAPGALDTSFSGDGLMTTDFTSKLDFAFDVAISETDGTIVAAGRAGGTDARFALARYTSSGALDPTFGGDGKVLTNFTPGFDSAFGVAIQADGKIVAAGAAAGSGGRIAVARYLTDGSLDPAFSGDGRQITNLTSGDDYAWAVAIQPGDQKIVIAGGAGGSGGRFMLARYNANGTLDSTFGNSGRVFTDFTSKYEYVDAIVIQGDDKILAAGSTNYFGSNPRFALARYETDGALDTTFSGDGKLTTGFAEGRAWAFGVALEIGGGIVAAGQAGSKVAVARYSASGVLDGSFSGDGRQTTNLTVGTDYADEVMIQADGSVVVVGSANYFGADARFAILRYQVGGPLDPTFSDDGKVLTNPSGGVDWALGAVLQPLDEKIVVAGRTSGTGGRFIVGRYLVT